MTTNNVFSFDVQRFSSQWVLDGVAGGLSVAGTSIASVNSSAGSTSTSPYYFTSFQPKSGLSVASVPTASAKWFSIAGGDSLQLGSDGGVNLYGVKNFSVALTGSANGVAWNNLIGGVSFVLGADSAFDDKINNTQFSLTGAADATINLNATVSGTMQTASLLAGGVTFDSVDAATWFIQNGASVALGDFQVSVAGADGKTATLASDKKSGLNFTMNSSGGVSFAFAGGDEETTLKIDGMTLGGTGLVGGGSIAKTGKEAYEIKAGGSSAVSVNSGWAELEGGATASIKDTDSDAYISAIDSLKSGGSWVIDTTEKVSLGSTAWQFSTEAATLVAGGSSGETAASVLFTGTATVSNSLGSGGLSAGFNVNDKVNWTFGNASLIGMSDTGNIETFRVLTAGGSVALDATQANDATSATFKTGLGDSLVFMAGTSAAITNDHVTAVYGTLAGGSEWAVGGPAGGISVAYHSGSTDTTVAFAKADTLGTNVLTMNSEGTAIAEIDSTLGNVTVTSNNLGVTAVGDGTDYSVTVNDKAWTIAGATNSVAAFDTLGNASISGSAAYVYGADSALVSISGAASNVTMNSAVASISGDDTGVVFGLETVGSGKEGIASITGLDNGATVEVADTSFVAKTAKYTYTVTSANTEDSLTSFVVNDTDKRLDVTIKSGESFAVEGGNAHFVIPGTTDSDIDGSTSPAASNVVTINGVAMTVNSGGTGSVEVLSTGTDSIAAVTISAGDAIYTETADQDFTVVVDSSNLSGTEENVVITINDTKITVDAAALEAATSDQTTLSVSVDSNGVATVNITGELASLGADYTVSEGVYKVGSNAAETITGENGYIKTTETGAATVEAVSVKEINEKEKSAISEITESTTGATVTPYQAFLSSSNRSALNATVANYAKVDDSAPTTGSAKSTGFNLYGNTSLSSDALNSITLEAYSATTDPLVINATEGSKVANAVIDFRSSDSTHAVAINTSSANHSVYGGSEGDTIIFGEGATGTNYAQAGSGAAYLYNKGKKASLIGGDGDDTIVAAAGDYVEGGSGADFFSDKAAYTVSDYSAEDGDIIIASKLSTLGITALNQISANGNVLQINGGSKVTLGSDYDDESSMAAIIAGADGSTTNSQYVAWASAYGSTVDASSAKAAIVLGTNNSAADYLVGGDGKDTIAAGGNDTVNSGAGADSITLKAADTSAGELGAVVALAAGKNSVEGWNEGFDNEDGDNILYHEGGVSGLTLKTKSGYLVASDSGSSVTFASDEVDGSFSFLVGTSTDSDDLDKVTFIEKEGTASVTSDSELADYFIAEKKGAVYIGSSVETALGLVSLGSDNFQNVVTFVDASAGETSIAGAAGSVKETVQVAGSLEDGAHKYVSLGGGNDSIISGGNTAIEEAMTAGNTFYFSAGDGKDTITNFAFYQGAEIDATGEEADLLVLGSFSSLSGNASKIEFATSASDKVIISRTSTDSIVRANIGGTVYNAKVGNTSGTNTFTYSSDANVYYGNSSKGKDTISAGTASDEAVAIWLNGSDGNLYSGIGVVDASGLTNSTATLVGSNGSNNTVKAAGSGSQSSLWGGAGGNNSLVGGAGEDTFVFLKGYGNNDTLSSVGTDDLVWLADTSLDDLDLDKMAAFDSSYGITNKEIRLYYKDGSELHIASPSTSTSVKLADGNTYTAVNRGSTRAWTV